MNFAGYPAQLPMRSNYTRGDIFLATLPAAEGSEQTGTRPVLVIQSDKLNVSGKTTVVIPISSKKPRSDFKTHVALEAGEGNLIKPSVIIVEQIRVIDSSRLYKKIGKLSKDKLDTVMESVKFLLS